MSEFVRMPARTLIKRLEERRRFIQVIAGARQTGKTTMARQVVSALAAPSLYASADEPTLRDRAWVAAQWEAARRLAREAGRKGAVLVLDEIQKVPGWSETVKRLWDEDTAARVPLRVVLLGAAPLLVQRGLTESLAGRFEVVRLPHWSFSEMRDAFGWNLDSYLFYGGYPGAAPLIADPERWRRYIQESLIETTISRDVLLLSRVDKPALLRRVFELSCRYSGQILAYQKMVGQLQDAGNTTTVAHYLDLLAGAGMVMGLQKYSAGVVRQRGSSPKHQVCNTALLTAQSGLTMKDARRDTDFWRRLIESAVGAHLVNATASLDITVHYWRDRNREVDFVVKRGRAVTAIEVKSGRRRDCLPGLAAFMEAARPKRTLLVGGDGIPVEEFLAGPVEEWVA